MNPFENTASPFGVRSLAAVMFTDVVNFSGLIGEREDRTLRLVQRDLDEISAAVAAATGRVIKTMGDGTLSYFDSAVSAVNCARHLQSGFARREAETPGSLRHRIGIHLGDVFVLDHDVLGNSVNIAARLLTCAKPGGICFSQTVYDVVRNRVNLQVSYIGPQELKHIREAVPAYMVAAEACLIAGMERVQIDAPVRPARGSEALLSGTVIVPTLAVQSGEPFARRTKTRRVLLLAADFSGRGPTAPPGPLAAPRPVDVDNFDAVFRQLGVRVRLPAFHRSGALDLQISSLDDLHPDRLLKKAGSLGDLVHMLDALRDARLAPGLVEHLQSLFASSLAPRRADEAAPPRTPAQEIVAKLLASPQRPGAAALSLDPLLKFRLGELVRTERLSPAAAAGAGAALAEVERELARELRAILHHPDWQCLEATWRGARRLIEDHGAGTDMEIYILDASRAQLTALGDEVRRHVAALGPAVIVADYYVRGEADDFRWLLALAQAGASAGAPLVTGALPLVAGCESVAREPDPMGWNIVLSAEWTKAWREFRTSDLARHVTLVAPRVLLRQPYGRGGEQVETFGFEELPENRAHEAYLWGNGVWAAAHFLARELAETGTLSSVLPGGEVADLPWCSFVENGEKRIMPCAEAWLTERAARILAERGLSPLYSVRDRNAVRADRLLPAASTGQ